MTILVQFGRPRWPETTGFQCLRYWEFGFEEQKWNFCLAEIPNWQGLEGLSAF